MEVWTELQKKIIKLKTKYEECSIVSIPNDHRTFAQESNRDQLKHQLLEKKLERVRDLVADNQLEKLKKMVRRGEI